MKTALVSGVSGQDGAYVARLLLDKGYRVVGTSRDANASQFDSLRQLGILETISCVSMALTDFRSTLQTLQQFEPDEIYHLAGQSSVGLSFQQPVEAMESIGLGTFNLLEAVRHLGKPTRLFNASSSECFGETAREAATESTPFQPRSPYGVAKAAAHFAVANYREVFGLFATNGILFNHESPLRPARFVTKKIVAGACRIKAGLQKELDLSDLTIRRDWGWAPEYVDAMWRVLQHGTPEDFVIATGTTTSLQDFVEAAFAELGLNWRDHVVAGASHARPSDISCSTGNPAKARTELNWSAQYKMTDVARMMVKAEFGALQRSLGRAA